MFGKTIAVLTFVMLTIPVNIACAYEITKLICVSDDGSIREDIQFGQDGKGRFALLVSRNLFDPKPAIGDYLLEFRFDEKVLGADGFIIVRRTYRINLRSERYSSQFGTLEGNIYTAGPTHIGTCDPFGGGFNGKG